MSAVLKPYMPRRNSSAELTMEHLTAYGPTAHTALADEAQRFLALARRVGAA